MTSRPQRREIAYPRHLIGLREVGLRDGLQLTKSWPDTAGKTAWLASAQAAGVRHFEVGSCLPAKRYPQFSDTAALVAITQDLPDARAAVLALNQRGVDDAIRSGADELVLVVSATEEHSLANARCSRDAALDLVAHAAQHPDAPLVNATISVAFGCSISGAVKPQEVARLFGRCIEAGADIVSLADTVGYAGPRQVAQICKLVRPILSDAILGAHFHDTRGTAIANAFAALDGGARILDGTIGGLGGCPFAPGATGNAVFEDLVFLCERSGFATGIDLDKLAATRALVEQSVPGERFHGMLRQAGPPRNMPWQSFNMTQLTPAD